MSYCRGAGEAQYFVQCEINEPSYDYDCDLKSIYLEELILCARNGDIYSIFKDEDAADGFVSALVLLGFIRPEFLDGSTPELRFVWNYLADQELLDEDDEEVFMPYYFSNRDYERYVFCYERVNGIFNAMADVLNEDEMYELRADVMFLGEYDCNKEKLESVKEKIREKKDVILPRLEEVFAKY